MLLIVLSPFAFGQMQISIFQPDNISANSIVSLTVELGNGGSLDRTQVRASLSSLDANVKVSKGYEYVGAVGRDSAQNVSFAFVLGSKGGTFPMQVIVHDSRGTFVKNFSVSSTGGIGYAGSADSASDEVFRAYEKVSALGETYDEIFRDAAECPAGEFEKANRSYSLARGHLSLAQQSFANKSYSAASQSAKLSMEWAESASSYGGLVLEFQRKCIEERRLLLLERERENFHRNISTYKRALSNLHVLIGFFEGQGANMSVERGVERNVADNVNRMEKLAEAEGGMARAVEIAGNTEMLLSAAPGLFEGRLSLIEGAVEDADYEVAMFYLRFDDAKRHPALAYSQIAGLYGGIRNAQSALERARASVGSARAYVSYRDFLFFSASAVEKLQEAEEIVYGSESVLGRLSDVADYKLKIGKFVLMGLLIMLVMGVALSAFLHQRGKWRVVESARGFHYKKRS